MASAIMGTAGASIGSLAGGTFGWTAATWSQIGWTAGVLAANYLFAPDGPEIVNEGSRLGDLKVTSSAYGIDIAKVYGSYRISGNIIWSLPLQETRHVEESDSGGKGGSSSSETNIWYTYSASFAVALCEGPITGIKRIWFGSKLVYDNGVPDPILNLDGTRFYLGDQTQMPDWLIQSKYPDTPAYRGIAYIVFSDLQLENLGNIIPNVTVEVVKNSGGTIVVPVKTSQDSKPYDSQDLQSSLCYYPGDSGICDVDSLGKYIFSSGGAIKTASSSSFRISQYQTEYRFHQKEDQDHFISLNENLYSSSVRYNESRTRVYFFYETKYIMVSEEPDNTVSYTGVITLNADATGYEYVITDNKIHDLIPHDNGFIYLTNDYDLVFLGSDYVEYNRKTIVWDKSYPDSDPQSPWLLSPTLNQGQQNWAKMCSIEGDLLYIACANRLGSGDFANSVEFYTHNISTNENIYLGIFKPGVPEFYFNNIANRCSITVTNGIAYIHNWDYFSTNYSEYFKVNLRYMTDDGELLGNIVNDICKEVGLDDIDLNTSSVTDSVYGYVITKNMSARSALEPLLASYEYNLIEHNHYLDLRIQAQSISHIVSIEDLGANEDNNIEYNKKQEIDRIKSIGVRYANPLSEYQTSIQQSRRIDSFARNEIVIDLPICLTDNQAKRISEKELYKDWIMSESYSFSLTMKYKDLIAGDNITIPFNNGFVDVSITSITTTENNLIKVNAVRTEEEIYNSTAIGQVTTITNQEVNDEIGITNFEILDIPTLSNNVINTEGLYIAATGYSNSWVGCTIYSKPINLDKYEADFVILSSTGLGVTATELRTDANSYSWDYSTVLVISSEPLESKTKDLILKGENYIIIGDEVLQYVNATEISSGEYELDTFLRGRRGTEHEISNHILGDRFVFLNSLSISFIPKALHNVSDYSAVSIGLTLDNMEPSKEITNTGVNLRPLSPSYIKTKRDSTSITIDWMRRSRHIAGYLKTLPIVDTPESYTLEFYNSSDVLVVEVTDVTTSDYIYNYLPDFATSDDIKIKIYHVSDVYGKGQQSDYITVKGI